MEVPNSYAATIVVLLWILPILLFWAMEKREEVRENKKWLEKLVGAAQGRDDDAYKRVTKLMLEVNPNDKRILHKRILPQVNSVMIEVRDGIMSRLLLEGVCEALCHSDSKTPPLFLQDVSIGKVGISPEDLAMIRSVLSGVLRPKMNSASNFDALSEFEEWYSIMTPKLQNKYVERGLSLALVEALDAESPEERCFQFAKRHTLGNQAEKLIQLKLFALQHSNDSFVQAVNTVIREYLSEQQGSKSADKSAAVHA